MMNRLTSTFLIFAVSALAAAGCTIDKTEVPALSGPSELSLSIALSAQPSILAQDGVSQSAISIQTRDANGQPARNISMRAEIVANSINGLAIFDYGRLSTKAPVTDSNGRATLMYTAPPRLSDPVDNLSQVTILVTPETGDNRSALARQIDIRLVPPGIVLPPNGVPLPQFTFSPSTPSTFSKVHFDGSTSLDDGVIVSFEWNFGDGKFGTGVEVDHEYKLSGVYNVTLTVTDDRGLSARTDPVAVSVTATAGPTAIFTFSPISPLEGDRVFFNATASTASEGHEIVSYKWNLGTSNGTASGISVSKVYNTAGSFTITLTVTDDAGQTGTASQTLNVVTETPTPPDADPVASFVFSPLQPAVGALVHFDAASSTPLSSIVSFTWDFGDGGRGTGVTPDHRYNTAGTYTVSLLVTDSNGNTDTTSLIVPVNALAADFTVNPLNPNAGDLVTVTATVQNATGDVSYQWDFGVGSAPSTGVGPSASTVYAVPGTYVITLTVTDDVDTVVVPKQITVQ